MRVSVVATGIDVAEVNSDIPVPPVLVGAAAAPRSATSPNSVASRQRPPVAGWPIPSIAV